MQTTVNKAEIFRNAWQLRKTYHIALSTALQIVWATALGKSREFNIFTATAVDKAGTVFKYTDAVVKVGQSYAAAVLEATGQTIEPKPRPWGTYNAVNLLEHNGAIYLPCIYVKTESPLYLTADQSTVIEPGHALWPIVEKAKQQKSKPETVAFRTPKFSSLITINAAAAAQPAQLKKAA